MITDWIANPIARAALRHSLGWTRLVPIIPAIMVEADRRAAGRPARIAVIALCYAAPQAAAYFLETEPDGRLDQLRLSGLPPAALALRTAAGVAGIWFAVAIIALLWMAASGGASVATILGMFAIAGIPTAMATAASTAPAVRDRIDPRIGVAALSVFAIATGVIGSDMLLRFTPWIGYYAMAVAIEAVIIAWFLQKVPARIAHAPIGRGTRPWTVRLPEASLLRWPGFYRGVRLSSSGFMLFSLFTPVMLMVWWIGRRSLVADSALFFFPLLIIGLIAVSLICREDAITGRLELVRQSSRAPARAALETIGGLWTPFVAAAAGVALVTWPFFGLTRDGVALAVVFVVLLAPLPVVEGWSRLWPMMTTIPFVIAMTMSRAFMTPLPLLIVAGLGWYSAIRLFQNPSRPILPDAAAVAVTALMCVGVFVPYVTIDPVLVTIGICGVLLLISQVLIDPGAGRLARWGQPLCVGLIPLVAITMAAGPIAGLWAATTCVGFWFCSYRTRQIAPERPAIQAAIRLATLFAVAQLEANSFRTLPGTGVLSAPAVLLETTIAAAALVEIGYRISLLRSRRPRALATPRP